MWGTAAGSSSNVLGYRVNKVSYTEVFLAHKWSEEIFLASLVKQYNKRLHALGKHCPLKLIRHGEIKDEGQKCPE